MAGARPDGYRRRETCMSRRWRTTMRMTHQQRQSLQRFMAKTHLEQRRRSSSSEVDGDDSYPVGHFDRRHGLTIEEAWLANTLLARANRRRRLTDPFRYSLRVAGVVSAVKRGAVGNSSWGRSMLAKRGGLAMKCHAPHILAVNREQIQQRRQALKTWRQAQQATRP